MKLYTSSKYIYGCVAILAYCDVYGGHSLSTHAYKYRRMAGKRSTISYRDFSCDSAVQCCIQCSTDESCAFASYSKDTSICELSGTSALGITDESGWNMYIGKSGLVWNGPERTSIYWFELETQQTNDEARVKCELLGGGHLVNIESEEEQLFLNKFIEDNFDTKSLTFWIGARDDGSETLADGRRAFFWTNGVLLADTYTNWGQGEPNGILELCATMALYRPNNRWNDDSCNVIHHYICEQEI